MAVDIAVAANFGPRKNHSELPNLRTFAKARAFAVRERMNKDVF